MLNENNASVFERLAVNAVAKEITTEHPTLDPIAVKNATWYFTSTITNVRDSIKTLRNYKAEITMLAQATEGQ